MMSWHVLYERSNPNRHYLHGGLLRLIKMSRSVVKFAELRSLTSLIIQFGGEVSVVIWTSLSDEEVSKPSIASLDRDVVSKIIIYATKEFLNKIL